MSQIHSRTVNPLSLMIDVFVELERLQCSLEKLRDEFVEHPDEDFHVELYDAQRSCRKIDAELRSIKSLLGPGKSYQPPAPSPKSPPGLKLIK